MAPVDAREPGDGETGGAHELVWTKGNSGKELIKRPITSGLNYSHKLQSKIYEELALIAL